MTQVSSINANQILNLILNVIEYALVNQEAAHAMVEFIIPSAKVLCVMLNHTRAKYGDSVSVKSACYQRKFYKKST